MVFGLMEMRRSDKVARGLENAEEMLKGWFVHYNFVRPH